MNGVAYLRAEMREGNMATAEIWQGAREEVD